MADISNLINEYAQMFYGKSEPFNTDDLHEIERISNRTAGGVTIALATGYMQGYLDALDRNQHEGRTGDGKEKLSWNHPEV